MTAVEPVSAVRRSLWRWPDFLRLWSAGAVSQVGDAITRLALPLVAIISLGASPLGVAALGAAQFAPFLLVGLPVGAFVDRLVRKRPVMVLTDIGRALTMASIPLAYIADRLTLPHLIAVAFIHGCLSAVFDVAASTYLPTLVARPNLVDANGKVELARSGAQIAGPGAAGLLVDLLTAPIALAADAISFVASALLLSRIRQREPADRETDRSRSTFVREIIEGTSYVLREPRVRAVALTALLANLFRSVLLAVLLIYLVREARAPAAAIGVALAIGNVGFVVGALVAAPLSRRLGVGPTMQAAVALFGPAALIIAIAPPGLAVYAVGAMVLLDTFGIGVHSVNQVSLRQAITPEHLRGRMSATVRFLILGAIPLGTMIGGVLGSALGLRTAIWVAVCGLFTAALPYAFSSVHRLISMPSVALVPGGVPGTGKATDAGQRA
jgi:MFS family permease